MDRRPIREPGDGMMNGGRGIGGWRAASRVRSLFALAALALAAALPARAAAQDPAGAQQDTVYRVTLVDGSTIIGRIVESSETRIVLRSEAGMRFEIERSQIRSMRPLGGRLVDGEVWPEDANRTRLFFGPTGRSLRHGEGYIGLYELFFSFAAVGIADRLTLAGGTPIIPGGIGEVLYFAPKVTIVNAQNFQFAAGALAFFLTDEIDEGSVGIAYGVGTWGSVDNAVSVGAGWGFALTSEASGVADEPLLMLGLERRVSRGVKLLSENYYISGGALLSGGIRLLGERFSADLGLAGLISDEDASFGLPLLNVAYRF